MHLLSSILARLPVFVIHLEALVHHQKVCQGCQHFSTPCPQYFFPSRAHTFRDSTRYQVITVFFGSFVAGTFANQFETLIKDPGSIVQILGTAAPQAAIFFLTFVLVRGMLGIPFSILRIVGLIIFWIKMKLASTPRAKRQVWANPDIQYGTLIPEDTITILLGLVFCVICPLIAPAVVVYFSIGYIVRKYNALYVFSESYQSGGLVSRHHPP